MRSVNGGTHTAITRRLAGQAHGQRLSAAHDAWPSCLLDAAAESGCQMQPGLALDAISFLDSLDAWLPASGASATARDARQRTPRSAMSRSTPPTTGVSHR